MVTVPDFSVPHTQFWCLWKEDPLGFTIHHPELIMLKNIKSYRHWSALIKIVPHWIFFKFNIKIHEISPGEIQKSNGLKVTCLMSLYFKSEEDTMKNEIPAAIFLVPPPPPPPPPPVWGKIFTKLLKGSTTNYLVIIHATAVFQL